MIVINNSLCIDIMHNWKCIAILPTTTSSAWCCALELLPSHLVSGPVCTSRSALSRPYHSSVLDLDPYEVHGLSPEYSAHGKRAAQSHYTSYEAEAEMCWKYMRSLLTPAITSFTLVTFIQRTVCIDLSVLKLNCLYVWGGFQSVHWSDRMRISVFHRHSRLSTDNCIAEQVWNHVCMPLGPHFMSFRRLAMLLLMS